MYFDHIYSKSFYYNIDDKTNTAINITQQKRTKFYNKNIYEIAFYCGYAKIERLFMKFWDTVIQSSDYIDSNSRMQIFKVVSRVVYMNVEKTERNKYFSLYFDIINVCVLCKKVQYVNDIFDILVSNSILNIDKKNLGEVTKLLREHSEVLENITKRINTYDSLCLFEEELQIGQNMLKSYEYNYIDLAADKYAERRGEVNIFDK